MTPRRGRAANPSLPGHPCVEQASHWTLGVDTVGRIERGERRTTRPATESAIFGRGSPHSSAWIRLSAKSTLNTPSARPLLDNNGNVGT